MYSFLAEQFAKPIPIPAHRQYADNDGDSELLNFYSLSLQFSKNQEWYRNSIEISYVKTLCVKYLSKLFLLKIPFVSRNAKIILEKVIS